MKRMMLYLWEDTDSKEIELKFGDHFNDCSTFVSAVEDTKSYIRSSLGRQKHKYDEGRIIVHHIWDASEYAKHVGRLTYSKD